MVSIEHPMTDHRNQKDINVVPQAMNELVIMSPEDEELVRMQMAEMDQVVQKRGDKLATEDPVIENELRKKAALENLVLFGKPHKKQVKVGNVTFTLKILSARDSDAVYQEVLRLPTEDQVTKASRMLLAASLVEADGMPLQDAYTGPMEIDNVLLQRYYIISSWPITMTNSLNRAYQKLVSESEKEFDFDFLDDS